jgi:hypothetical protein
MTLQFTPISEIQKAYEQQRLLSNQRVINTPKRRIEQLKRLRNSIAKYEAELLEALKTDLGKSNYEGFLTERKGMECASKDTNALFFVAIKQ